MLALAAVTSTSVHGNPDKYKQAGVLLDRGEFKQALTLYQEFLQEQPALDAQRQSRVLNNIGFSHYKLDRLTEAQEYYDRALALSPDYATCLNNMGVLLINQKRFDDALPYLERAYRQEQTVKIAFNLFAVHYYLDHRKEALAFIEKAMKLDESYTEGRLKAKNIRQSDIDKLKRRVK